MSKYEFCLEGDIPEITNRKKLRLELTPNGFILKDQDNVRIIDANNVSENGLLTLWTQTYSNGTTVKLNTDAQSYGGPKPNYVEVLQ